MSVKQSLATVGQTLVDADGDFVELGYVFLDADSAIAKVATAFGNLSDSARADLARVFAASNISGTENAHTSPVSAISDTSGIVDSIINGNVNDIVNGLFALAAIIDGDNGGSAVPSLAELSEALREAGGVLDGIQYVNDRADLDRAFAEAGVTKTDDSSAQTDTGSTKAATADDSSTKADDSSAQTDIGSTKAATADDSSTQDNAAATSKQSLATVGHTLVDANGSFVALGNAFVDADSAIAKVADVFGSLSDSARADLARVFAASNISGTENAHTTPVSAIRDTSGIIDSIINGDLNDISGGLSALAAIIKGQDGAESISSLADLGKALGDAGSALAKVADLVSGLSASARTDLNHAFVEAGFAKADDNATDVKTDTGSTQAADTGSTSKDTGNSDTSHDNAGYVDNSTKSSDTAKLIGSYDDSGSGSTGVDHSHSLV